MFSGNFGKVQAAFLNLFLIINKVSFIRVVFADSVRGTVTCLKGLFFQDLVVNDVENGAQLSEKET